MRIEALAGDASPERAAGAQARAKAVQRARIFPRRLSLVAPVLILAFISAFFTDTDPDFWWHLRTGRHILETRAIPQADPFSYTALGQPWVAHEWLSEVLFALVSRIGGYAGNTVLFGLVSALTALLVYATCRAHGIGDGGAALLALWGFLIAFPVTNWRPQLITTALLALYALLLTRYRRGSARALWSLPPLMVLWVNFHGGYVIGLALLGFTLVGDLWSHLRGRAHPPLRPLALTVALAGLATLVSPLGLEALRYPFLYLGTKNFAMRHIADFQSPSFHQAAYLPLALSLLVAIAVGVWRRPLAAAETLWALVFSLMALQSVRHIQLYAVVVLPLLGARIVAELPPLPDGLAAQLRRVRIALATFLWLPAAIAVVALVGAVSAGTAAQFRAEPSAASYPAGAADYLLANDLRGNLYNEYHWGGYLIYRLYPSRLVFIDGRADVYGDAFVGQYQQLVRLQTDWRRVFDEHDVRLALVAKDGTLARALRDDPAWREVYVGAVERLFERAAPANGPLPVLQTDGR